MHFDTKNTLKNNRNHTPKQAIKTHYPTSTIPPFLLFFHGANLQKKNLI